MKIISENDVNIDDVAAILEKGGVVAHATETCYGLACDLTNPDAVQKLFDLKHRPSDMPVSALFESAEQAMLYTQWIDEADTLARENLPGPLTIILPLRIDAPYRLFPTPDGGKTIGIRVSSYPLAEEIVRVFGKPLSTTSANIHGQSNPYSGKQIEDQYKAQFLQPDLVIESGKLEEKKPSSVILLLEGKLSILRE